jgi:polygalacturonase
MKTLLLFAGILLWSLPSSLHAQQDYKASLFGIRSDGSTLNTRSVQKAIDYISENGGGRLVFYVGRYRTGTIRLKSNVSIQLREGAALVASTSPYDYEYVNGRAALIIAQGQQNTGITGEGVIEGEGTLVNRNIDLQTARGNLPKGQESFRPALIYMDNCSAVSIDSILLRHAGGNVQEYTGCRDIVIKGITVESRHDAQTQGIVLEACSGVELKDSYIDTPSAALALKGSASKGVKVKNSITPNGKKIVPTPALPSRRGTSSPPAEESGEVSITGFGVTADGETNHTQAIQRAIDKVHETGGGRLVFPLGRYVSGSLSLKSDVTLHLEAGAILSGSTNPLDYDKDNTTGTTAFLLAHGQENIGITGEGTIDCRGRQVACNLVDLIHRGVIRDPLKNDRPVESIRPMIVYFRSCNGVKVEDIHLLNSASWVQTYDQCRNLAINRIHVKSNAYWNNDGLDVVDCENVTILHSDFDAADDAICLKSHDPAFICRNILIQNNVARSGASGIKFGTVSRGGFVNVRIRNNKIYDTFRSAITFAAVDGALIENIEVDSLTAIHTGNVLYLRIGDRWSSGKQPVMRNISISNVYAEVPAEKPDKGYDYEGPVEDLPRNTSPASIVGLAGHHITGVRLRNIEIVYPGDAQPLYAQRGTTPAELDSIPEMHDAYPEFSQFRELPAWAFYIRHAGDIEFENVTVTARKKDYRPAFVLDDVHQATFKQLQIAEPGDNRKEQMVIYKSSGIVK